MQKMSFQNIIIIIITYYANNDEYSKIFKLYGGKQMESIKDR